MTHTAGCSSGAACTGWSPLEVHLRPVFNDPATLFEVELLDAVG
jgi:hypothetical protein